MGYAEADKNIKDKVRGSARSDYIFVEENYTLNYTIIL